MTEKKRTEEKCIQQSKSCGSVLPIKSQGCYDNLENDNPTKTVIA